MPPRGTFGTGPGGGIIVGTPGVGIRVETFTGITDESNINLGFTAWGNTAHIGVIVGATWADSTPPINLGSIGFIAAPGYSGAGSKGQFRWSPGAQSGISTLILAYLATE